MARRWLDQDRRYQLGGALTMVRHCVIGLAVVGLAGCTNLSGLGGQSSFQCSAPQGVPCMSVSGVHANERAGTLAGLAGAAKAAAGGGKAETASPDLQAEAALGYPLGGPSGSSSGTALAAKAKAQTAPPAAPSSAWGPPTRPLGAIRSEPVVLRLWVAPWEDQDGDLHDQGYVYLQVDAGRWLIEHNRERIRRAFAPQTASAAPGSPAASAPGAAAPAANATNAATSVGAPTPGARAALAAPLKQAPSVGQPSPAAGTNR